MQTFIQRDAHSPTEWNYFRPASGTLSGDDGETPDTPVVEILLVDDRDENLLALEAILSDLNLHIVKARSGQEALRCLLHQDFAVILMDVRMPGMDGFETATLIRSRQRSCYAPIIFLTAYSDEVPSAQAYAHGAVDFLFKPIVPEVLRSKVSVFVELFKKSEAIRLQGDRLREAQRTAHQRALEQERHRWEAERLREEVAKEKQLKQQLEENYRRLKELEALRDDLTHMIVHDLRTPLTSLLTGLQTLAMAQERKAQDQELLEIAIRGGESLLGMINNLLDLKKMEAGALRLERDAVAIEEVILQAIHQVDYLAKEKHLTLEIQIPKRLPTVPCDRDKVCRILVNLLGNAIKFTPPKGTIKVSAKRDNRKAALVISVQDTGEGIPSSTFEQIFEKFGQVEARKAGRKMSTGLGLTFCKMAVEAHGGRIWVESEQGCGSTFSFALPLTST